MGAYSKSAVRWLEGRYLAIRPSFNTPDDTITYLIDIACADEACHLDFAKLKRDGAMSEQSGCVSLLNLSGHIYLVTNESGQYRLMILSRPTVDGSLYGTLSTLTLQPFDRSKRFPNTWLPFSLRETAPFSGFRTRSFRSRKWKSCRVPEVNYGQKYLPERANRG
jgi:hypothetical protein